MRLDEEGGEGANLVGPGPVGHAAQRVLLATSGAKLQNDRAQLLGEQGVGPGHFHADATERRLQAKARFDADQHQVERIGKAVDDLALAARRAREVVVLAPPVEDANAALLALLADGEAWSSSALALALDMSPRTVQRALEQLAAAGKVQSLGRGRARRWMTQPIPGFPTTLLLPGPLPSG